MDPPSTPLADERPLLPYRKLAVASVSGWFPGIDEREKRVVDGWALGAQMLPRAASSCAELHVTV